LVAVQGEENEIRVFAKGPPGKGPPQAFQGEARFRPGAATSQPQEVQVALEAWHREPIPSSPEPVNRMAFDSPNYFGHVHQILLTDAVSGEPIGNRRVKFQFVGSTGMSTISPGGLIRIQLAPGIQHVIVTVDGYQPRYLELDIPFTSYGEETLSLQPYG